MTLKEQGFKFCVRPDKQRGSWLSAAEIKHSHQDWIDVTDLTNDQLVAYLMPAPEQRELFAA